MLKSFLAQKALPIAFVLAGAGLLSAAAIPSSTTFTGSITLANNEFDNYFVYSANGGSVAGAQGFGVTNPLTKQSDFVPAGTFPVTKTIPAYITSGVATAMGLYSATGVSVAVNQSVYNNAANKESWDQVFTGTSESSIAAALASGDQATLAAFLNQYSADFISFSSNTTTAFSGGILDFSNAVPGGSLTFSSIVAVGTSPDPGSPTPEPSTYLLLSAGLGVIALTGRKLRKA